MCSRLSLYDILHAASAMISRQHRFCGARAAGSPRAGAPRHSSPRARSALPHAHRSRPTPERATQPPPAAAAAAAAPSNEAVQAFWTWLGDSGVDTSALRPAQSAEGLGLFASRSLKARPAPLPSPHPAPSRHRNHPRNPRNPAARRGKRCWRSRARCGSPPPPRPPRPSALLWPVSRSGCR